MAEESFVLSRTGYEALQRELAALEAEHKQQQADFEGANEDPDSSPEEGASFDTRTTKEYLEERIGHIKLVLEHAEIVENDPHPKAVHPGERVTVWDVHDKQERMFNVVSSAETVYARNDIQGQEVSVDSPVGQALLGKHVGDMVQVDVPDGKAHYAVRRIESLDG